MQFRNTLCININMVVNKKINFAKFLFWIKNLWLEKKVDRENLQNFMRLN